MDFDQKINNYKLQLGTKLREDEQDQFNTGLFFVLRNLQNLIKQAKSAIINITENSNSEKKRRTMYDNKGFRSHEGKNFAGDKNRKGGNPRRVFAQSKAD